MEKALHKISALHSQFSVAERQFFAKELVEKSKRVQVFKTKMEEVNYFFFLGKIIS